MLLSTVLVFALGHSRCSAQDIPWEYNPYRIHCWLSVDPSLGWDAREHDDVQRQIVDSLDRTFGAAATVSCTPTPPSLSADVLYSLSSLKLDTLLGRELVIATSRKHAEGKDARTMESAVENLSEVAINSSNLQSFRNNLLAARESNEFFPVIAERLKPFSGPTSNIEGNDPVAVALANAEIPIAIVSRAFAKANSKEVRSLPAVYPWHLQSVLNQYDKIIAVAITRDSVGLKIELREIDCVLRSVGLQVDSRLAFDSLIGKRIASLARSVFVPYVRLESADATMAVTRVRAGALISDPNHPCHIGTGDVLRPIVRRDDRSGEPSLIQYIPWTFMVVSDGADAKFNCAIFSGVRNPLQGRPNRRLRKLATLVRPVHDQTELKLKIAGPRGGIVPGCAVYRRTPGTEDLELVGRSDWRGIISIAYESLPTVQYEKPQKKADTKEANASDVAEAAAPEASTPNNEGTPAEGESKPVTAPEVAEKAKPEMIQLQANAPLYFYYVKNGNRLLAKLPVVTGLESLQIADLPDDSKRLEAEAFIKGVEGQILDVVARRLLLRRKIENALGSANVEEAKKLLDELKQVKDYNSFSEDLNAIQQRILSTSEGNSIPLRTQRSIDKMFEITRGQMQKYLQDSNVREMEVAIVNFENGTTPAPEPVDAPASAAADVPAEAPAE